MIQPSTDPKMTDVFPVVQQVKDTGPDEALGIALAICYDACCWTPSFTDVR